MSLLLLLRSHEAPVVVDTLTLVPATGIGRLNSPYSLIATLKDEDGNPRAGVTLYFEVTGANPETFDDVTDALGQVTFTYTGTATGTDTVTVTTTTGDYETIVLADGPEVYYRFPNSTDPIPDASGNGIPGNPGGTYTQNVAGVAGEAISVGAGAAGYVTADTPVMHPDTNTGKESYEFWLYRTAAAPVAIPVIVEGQNGFLPTIVWRANAGQGIGIRKTGGLEFVCAPNAPALNTWEHYVIVNDQLANEARVYLNAELVASGGFDDVTKGFHQLGTDSDTPELSYFTGRIDEFAYYQRDLTEAEITEHYEAIAGESEEATVEWAVYGGGNLGRRSARVVP